MPENGCSPEKQGVVLRFSRSTGRLLTSVLVVNNLSANKKQRKGIIWYLYNSKIHGNPSLAQPTRKTAKTLYAQTDMQPLHFGNSQPALTH